MLSGTRQQGLQAAARKMKGRARSGEVSKQLAREAYTDILPTMREWRKGGTTFYGIAAKLNESRRLTRYGKQWTPTQVRNVLVMSGDVVPRVTTPNEVSQTAAG